MLLMYDACSIPCFVSQMTASRLDHDWHSPQSPFKALHWAPTARLPTQLCMECPIVGDSLCANGYVQQLGVNERCTKGLKT